MTGAIRSLFSAVGGREAADYFELFGLPRSPDLDADELAARYRKLQREAHPDRFAGASEVERRLALARSSRINDGYATLREPLARAAYILRLFGEEAFAEDNTAMPPDFLMAQLEWREALDEAMGDAGRLAALAGEVARELAAAEKQTAAALTTLIAADGGDGDSGGAVADACGLARQWAYWQKLARQVEGAALAAGGGGAASGGAGAPEMLAGSAVGGAGA